MTKISFFILGFIICFAIIFPFFYHFSGFAINANDILLPPSFTHIFGTDRLGRDELARICQGARISLLIGFCSAFISSLLGLVFGISIAFLQNKMSKILILILDLFLTIPTFFLLLSLVSYLGVNIFMLIIVISLTSWMFTARLIKNQSYEISSKSFIKILAIAKVSKFKIFFKYFTPLLAPIFLVSFSLNVAGAILAESGLSFLGLGISSPMISLGSLINEGRNIMDIAWWLSFFPGAIIFLLSFCLIYITDNFQVLLNKKDLQGI